MEVADLVDSICFFLQVSRLCLSFSINCWQLETRSTYTNVATASTNVADFLEAARNITASTNRFLQMIGPKKYQSVFFNSGRLGHLIFHVKYMLVQQWWFKPVTLSWAIHVQLPSAETDGD